MMFYASKILWFVTQPSLLLVAGVIAGAWLSRGAWARTGRRLAIGCGVLLLALGIGPVGNWLALPLEQRFPRPDPASLGDLAGIIVLGGAIDTTVSGGRGLPALNEAAERMTEAVALARRFPGLRVIFTGGDAGILYPSMSEADAARRLFEDLGLPPGRIELEGASRTTWENAVLVRELVAPGAATAPGRWLLVTSAFHMPRSVGTFRAAGFDVVAWPVDFRTQGVEDLTRFFDKPSEGLRRVDIILREWVGLAAYRLTGRSSALWPGP